MLRYGPKRIDKNWQAYLSTGNDRKCVILKIIQGSKGLVLFGTSFCKCTIRFKLCMFSRHQILSVCEIFTFGGDNNDLDLVGKNSYTFRGCLFAVKTLCLHRYFVAFRTITKTVRSGL